MIHHCEKCPGTAALKAFLDEELDEFKPDSEFQYLQWQTTDRAALVTLTTTCEEFKDTLIKSIKMPRKYLKEKKKTFSS